MGEKFVVHSSWFVADLKFEISKARYYVVLGCIRLALRVEKMDEGWEKSS